MDKSNILGKTAQLISIVVQVIAITALIVTVVLVLDRKAICSFYEIPVTYSSLDTVSVIPIVVIFIMPAIALFISVPFFEDAPAKKTDRPEVGTKDFANKIIDVFLKKKERQENNSNNTEEKVQVNSGGCDDKVDQEDKKAKAKKHTYNRRKNDKKDKRISYIEEFRGSIYKDYSLDKTAKSTIDITLFIATTFFLSMVNFEFHGYMGRPLVAEVLFGIVLRIIIFSVLYLCMLLIGILFLTNLRDEYDLYLIAQKTSGNKEVEKQQSFIIITGRPDYIKSKLIIFIVIAFWVLSTSIDFYENLRLLHKNQYDIVEIKNDEEVQDYAVILNLNDYYVLEPIEENGTEMTINTEWYIYKKRNDLKIYHKYYKRVSVEKYSYKAKEELVDKILNEFL